MNPLRQAELKLEAYRAATAAIGACSTYTMASTMTGGLASGSVPYSAIKTEAERLWGWMTAETPADAAKK